MVTERTQTWLPPELSDHSHSPAGLDAFQRDLVLSVCPAETEITGLTPHIPTYARYPLTVDVRRPDGWQRSFALNVYPDQGEMETETKLLPVLARLGLPVCEVLAGPVAHPQYPDVGQMVLLAQPSGRKLPFINAKAIDLDLTCELLLQSVDHLHQLTEPLQEEEAAKDLPRKTLIGELDEVVDRDGPWLEESAFADAVERLRPALGGLATPLVFSTGNYNTWHLLYDGKKLTCFLYFVNACFEDPLIGFAKYRMWEPDTYGWGPFKHAGLIERYLYRHNLTQADFAPRLAVRCLAELQNEIPVAGEEKVDYRAWLLKLIQDSLAWID